MQLIGERAGAIARSLGEFLLPSAVQERLPIPERRIALSTEPFATRWDRATDRSLVGRIRFVEKEVFSLIQQAEGEIKPGYHFARKILDLSPGDIEESSLPEEVQAFFVDAPFPGILGWETPKLDLITGWGQGETQFKASIYTYLANGGRHGMSYWIEASGVEESHYDPETGDRLARPISYIHTEVTPDWEREDTHAIRASEVFQNLEGYVNRNSPFAVTRELVRFANGIILSSEHLPGPQSK